MMEGGWKTKRVTCSLGGPSKSAYRRRVYQRVKTGLDQWVREDWRTSIHRKPKAAAVLKQQKDRIQSIQAQEGGSRCH